MMREIHYKNSKKQHCGNGVARFLLAAALLFCVVSLSAKSPRKSDYVNLGLNVGYSALAGKSSDMKVPGGFTSGLHIGYEYREGMLWFGANGEFQYFSSVCSSDISIDDLYFLDTRMMQALMKYTMHSQRTEMQNFGIARISLMVGYCTGNNNRGGFYVGGGIKLGSKFDLQNTSKLKYSTAAEYDRYIDDYEDMPNHYYTVNTVNDTVVFGNNIVFSLIGEIGWDLKMDRCNRLKVGFYLESGLNNIMNGVATREPWVNEENVTEVKPYSAYNSEAMKEKHVVPIMAGVKISFLFNVSRINSRCHTCPCYRKR